MISVGINGDAFKIHDELHREFWDDKKLNPRVRKALLRIGEEFAKYIGAEDNIKDVTFTGSMANYNYTPMSDIDLHIILDYGDIDDNQELVGKLLRAKKALFNKNHDIKIYDYDVELYPQDTKEPHYSTGVYSVTNDEWIAEPVQQEVHVDDDQIIRKGKGIIEDTIETIVPKSENPEEKIGALEKIKEKIIKMRRSGLEKGGQYSLENLTFKYLRNLGILEQIFKAIRNEYDKMLSLSEGSGYGPVVDKAVSVNKQNVPILLGHTKAGSWRPYRKNKKFKPYTIDPKPHYLSAPPGAVGGGSLEEASTMSSGKVEVYGTKFPGPKPYTKIAYTGYASATDPATGNKGKFVDVPRTLAAKRKNKVIIED
jgi:predicted nucleotidyltransferase